MPEQIIVVGNPLGCLTLEDKYRGRFHWIADSKGRIGVSDVRRASLAVVEKCDGVPLIKAMGAKSALNSVSAAIAFELKDLGIVFDLAKKVKTICCSADEWQAYLTCLWGYSADGIVLPKCVPWTRGELRYYLLEGLL